MADLIPVIKGRMGTRDYYVGVMSFQELAAKVQLYEELKTSEDLDELLQRELSKRAQELTRYLLKQKERFYGAIIIAAWGGNPGFIKVKMEDHPLLNSDFNYGLLKFDGRQEYFALDGQHRLKSIKEAIQENQTLRKEEVSVIILTHEQTDEGNIRTRRLFHTLNRYARPTTTGENVALDEDNVISITTRMLLKNIKLLRAEALELKAKNIGKGQEDKFSSLAALFDFNSFVLEALFSFEGEYLRFRPPAEHVERVYDAISSLWLLLRKSIVELQDVESGLKLAGELREPAGDPAKGHLLFRPVGLSIYGKVIALLVREEQKEFAALDKEFDPRVWDGVWTRLKSLPLIVGESPWGGTIFRNNKMEPSAKNLAVKLAAYMLGIQSIDEKELLDDYRGHLEDERAELPKVL